jgi:hypothetical protein
VLPRRVKMKERRSRKEEEEENPEERCLWKARRQK